MASQDEEILRLKQQIIDLRSTNIALLEAQIGILSLTVSNMYDHKIDVRKVFDEIQQAHRDALQTIKGMING